jgi:hypothetical protein
MLHLLTCAQARACVHRCARLLRALWCVLAHICVLLVRTHALQGTYVRDSARMSAHAAPVDMCASARVRTQLCLLACLSSLVCAVRAYVCLWGACMHCRVRMCMAAQGNECVCCLLTYHKSA